MSVVRTKKSAEKPYVMLDTTALNDTRLSFRAKGLHTYLMSKTDGWQVYIEALEKISPLEGRDAIRSAMTELEKAGYIRRQKVRGEKGRMAGWDTTVYETQALAIQDTEVESTAETIGLTHIPPTTAQPKSDEPKSDEPKSDEPKSANPQLVINDLRVKALMGDNPSPPTGDLPPPKKQRGKQPAPAYSPGFLRFVEAYPKGRFTSKPTCYQKWAANGLEPRTEELIEKIERLKMTNWQDDYPRYVPYSLTWFNQKRWEDDLVPMPAPVVVRLNEKELRNAQASLRVMERIRQEESANESPGYASVLRRLK